MPTESLPRAEVVARYGEVVDRFHPGARDQPVAPGLPAGTVTDDTEQAVLLGELLVESGGGFDPAEFGRRLLAWEGALRARGAHGLLGPSTRRAVAALAAGADPVEAGRDGTTNGAAMRIAPAGVAVADPDALLELVVRVCTPTHGTGVAIAGAAAVAAAVSAGIDGATVAEATAHAVGAARRGAGRGRWVAAADVAARIEWATGLVAGLAPSRAVEVIGALVGTGLATQESVPAAFAVLATAGEDPWLTCRLAASLGGDTDTVAAMAGAVAGACHGTAGLPDAAMATVAEVNGLPLDRLAADLLALRGPIR
ncbi:ADP-ribosylglycohydrolase family protein [Pseudonocardia sp. S2-4]|uniref:ADP-ribosylglycohydrolase family protein n=2 Tax=Pseudonocardia humida TaxID=2800819 RepID=A0ABT1AD74_9PSEU|nr:ADP-ribosylglycohydrolase family protein [Pseudonocardia humida]